MHNHYEDSHDIVDMDEHDGDLLAGMVEPTESLGSAASGANANPPKIRVIVRTRPINTKELEKGDENIVDVNPDQGEVIVAELKTKVDLAKYTETHRFVFDDSLDHSVDNDTVYSFSVQPLVQTIFRAGKATCFAYGQTGSGKTYTMSPLPPRAAAEILYLLEARFPDLDLFVSCFEIYGNKVFDLLNERKVLNVREDGKKRVNVVGLLEFHVQEENSVQMLLDKSAACRQTGQTGANAESSRSHSIMQFSLKQRTADGSAGGREIGRLSFIDLAGSERGADTYDNDKRVRMEGAEINKSLLALKECIRALDSGSGHIPFRGSKLTEVLRDSFVGEQARTVMIANISPSSSSVEHTLNTLRYADRVKELRKDKAQRNPGGVTPGANNAAYNIAAQRGAAAAAPPPRPAPAPAAPVAPAPAAAPAAPPPRQPFASRNERAAPASTAATSSRGALAAAAPRHTGERDGGSDAENRNGGDSARQRLLDAILEEEDDLIQAHRKEIEASMSSVREEMGLLADVDKPDAQLQQYVKKLRLVLDRKQEAIDTLLSKLTSFESKLRQQQSLVAGR